MEPASVIRLRHFWVPLLLVAASLLLAACGERVVVQAGGEPDYRHGGPPGNQGPPPWAPAHGYRAKHRYRYYPYSEIYYDVGRGVYIYYGGGRWRVSVSLPSGIRLETGDYVKLEMDTDEPYRYHDEVRRRYPPGRSDKRGKDKPGLKK